MLEGLPAPRVSLGRRAAVTAAPVSPAGPSPGGRAPLRERVARLDAAIPRARRARCGRRRSRTRSQRRSHRYYHLGVAHLAAGELEEARLAFFDALALDPEDAIARFDLEWTLAALARRPPPRPAETKNEQPAAKLPQPAPEAPPRNEVEPAPGKRREPADVPPTLGGEERRRLLNRVPDDPSRALRLTARSDLGGAAARAQGPAW